MTCRYRFTLPGEAEQALSFRQPGALSQAETMKLAWSLPALDRLDQDQLEQVWRLAGGHPRSLEYLDALLGGGTARYLDVTARLAAAITRRLDGIGRDQWLAARTRLDAALAETVALAADDVLLADLLTRLAQVPGATGGSATRPAWPAATASSASWKRTAAVQLSRHHLACESARDQAPPRLPQAEIDLRRLAAYRSGTGPGPFTSIVAHAAGSPDLAEAITSLLDQLDQTDDTMA